LEYHEFQLGLLEQLEQTVDAILSRSDVEPPIIGHKLEFSSICMLALLGVDEEQPVGLEPISFDLSNSIGYDWRGLTSRTPWEEGHGQGT
jgi:hypothetical protein